MHKAFRFAKPATWLALGLLATSFVPMQHTTEAATLQAPTIAKRFQAYYNQQQGPRVLGNPVSEQLFAYTYPAQYFEKGRIEDHRGESGNPAYAFAYGLLTSELMEGSPNLSVSTTSLTYTDLKTAHEPNRRVSFNGGKSGVIKTVDGTFVPFDAGLNSAAGYVVPDYFWDYINRADLFPGGWLHDVGLPMTPIMSATVVKNGETRAITMQAFERAVLSNDPKNPADFRIERGNIGADAAKMTGKPEQTEVAAIQLPAPNQVSTLPLHIVARFKGDDTQIEAELKWSDGTVFTNTMPVLREDGDPIVVDSINWLVESEPPHPATNNAVLTLKRMSGEVLAKQNVTILYYNDPNTQRVDLYFVDDVQDLQRLGRNIPKTQAVASAALQELFWGLDPSDLTGFTTAIPKPEEVLGYMARESTWGPRVTLRGLVISNGVASVNLSREIDAYGGGSARVGAIYKQIEATLKQFSSVKEIKLAVEGKTDGILQP